MYEAKVVSFLQNGYEAFTSEDEQNTVAKALRALRINAEIHRGFIVGDAPFQRRMFDTAAINAIVLGTTEATATQIVEAFDVSTFVNAATSINYTVDTADKLLKVADGVGTAVIVSNAFAVSTTSNYFVANVGAVTLGTGTVMYEVSLDAGVTFKQIYAGQGLFVGLMANTGNFVFRVTLTGNAQVSGGIGFQCR